MDPPLNIITQDCIDTYYYVKQKICGLLSYRLRRDGALACGTYLIINYLST